MTKNPYNHRLKELFAHIVAVKPEPPDCGPTPPEPETVFDLLRERVNMPARPGPAVLEETPAIFTPSHSGWLDFLDGIRRKDQLVYGYGSAGVQEIEALGNGHEPSSVLDRAITISGEEIGRLLLESAPDRPWTADHQELVDAVALQLAQQIETLRLLDEAQRSRNEAEEALHRLSHQTGQALSPERDQAPYAPLSALTGWAEDGAPPAPVFDQEAAKDGLPASLPEGQALSAPIRVSGEVLGQLEVAGEQPFGVEAVNLVETVAQRLARQVENLRLLEEARHFRSETEDAIRRLTYQSWQSYLAGTAKSRLGFQYDQNQVSGLGPATGLAGRAFPLKVRDEVIGRLAVEAETAGREEVAGLVGVITDRLSAHLEGLRLAEQREQALAETETLYGISARLSTAQSFEEALSCVSDPARASGARDSRLFFVTVDEHGQMEGLSLAAVWHPEEGAQLAPVSTHFLLEEFPAYLRLLADPGSPLLVGDVAREPRLDAAARELFEKCGARAAAVLPLTVSGHWVGAIFLHWEQPRVFDEQENRLYASLARQAAVVVNNRLLLEQTRKRAQELQTVAQVSTAASTILDPQELLQSVVDLTRSSFSLYHVQVFLYRDREGYFEVAAGSGETGRRIVAEGLYVMAGSITAVARSGRERQGMIINDVAGEPGFVPHPLLPEVRSEIVIPMFVGDRLLGVFNVQAAVMNRFSREDLRTFSTLASQVAVALQNAELYAEQAATVERLRELDHLKSAFLANMSHELRTPLNSILGFAEVLLLELDGPLNETMTNDIRLIEKNGKHLLSLINDVLDMAKIEAGKMSLVFEKFLLRDLIEETIDISSSLAREKALYLLIEPGSQDQIEISADRVRVRQVLINVISNAVKFTEKGGVSIRVEQFSAERKVQIRFKDTGMGIPSDKLEMVFESFSQVDTSTTRKASGTGLGLPISRRLIEMHGGRLWAESTGVASEGSELIVELPFEAHKG
jgi:signal transduction histidine kinase